MKIGIVTTWFDRGASFVSKQFMHELGKSKNEIYIYARGGEYFAKGNPDWDQPNVTWNSFNDSFVPTDINLLQYFLWIKKNKIEVIIFNEQQYWIPVLLTKIFKIKTVAYIDYYTTKTFKFFRIYDQLWCNTQRHYEVFKSYGNAKFIKWGTNINKFLPVENKDPKIRIYHSSGMNPHRKGTDILIKSLKNIKKSQLEKFDVLIHSQVELHEDMDFINVNKNIRYELGTFDASKHLGWADIYIYPSRLDGIGLTLAESISSGCYVITTNEPPMNEFAKKAFSSLIKVDSYKRRSDNYYWMECEPSIDSLTDILNSLNKESIIEKKILARNYAQQNLDFESNMSQANKFLLELSQTKIDIKTFIAIFVNDILNLMMANVLFRKTNTILKKIYRRYK